MSTRISQTTLRQFDNCIFSIIFFYKTCRPPLPPRFPNLCLRLELSFLCLQEMGSKPFYVCVWRGVTIFHLLLAVIPAGRSHVGTEAWRSWQTGGAEHDGKRGSRGRRSWWEPISTLFLCSFTFITFRSSAVWGIELKSVFFSVLVMSLILVGIIFGTWCLHAHRETSIQYTASHLH